MLYLSSFDILYDVQCRALKSIDQLTIWTSTEEKKFKLANNQSFLTVMDICFTMSRIEINNFTHNSILKVGVGFSSVR